MKKIIKNSNGITLIALVVTIVVLLILASIGINTLTGDEGIINQAKQGKDASEISEEKEIINISVVQAIDEDVTGDLSADRLKTKLDKNAGQGKTEVIDGSETIIVKFAEKNRYYEIDKDGNTEGPKELIDDKYAGDISKGGKLDGTEENPFEINCIEDLVAFSQTVNNKNTYSGKYIKMMRTLDFNSIFSYNNYETNEYDTYLGGYGATGLMQQLSETGKGFIPIGTYLTDSDLGKISFQGIFDGQGYEIKNVYENVTSQSGIFGTIQNATIKNIGITGKIINSSCGGALINSANNSYIFNCYNGANVIAQACGGICYSTTETYIFNCYNYGKISGRFQTGVGGIVGTAGKTYIYNSYNLADLELVNGNRYAAAGGIVGYVTEEIYIRNCYNLGKVTSSRYAGSIVGGYDADRTTVQIILENCYYLNNMNKGIGCTDTDSALLVSLSQIRNIEKIESESEYIINLLNKYVKTYNESNTEEVNLKIWIKDMETKYPVFE